MYALTLYFPRMDVEQRWFTLELKVVESRMADRCFHFPLNISRKGSWNRRTRSPYFYPRSVSPGSGPCGSSGRVALVLVVIFATTNSSFECAAVPCIVAADVNDSFVLRIRPWTWLKVSQQLRGRGTWFKAGTISRGIALRLTSAAPRARSLASMRSFARVRVRARHRPAASIGRFRPFSRVFSKIPPRIISSRCVQCVDVRWMWVELDSLHACDEQSGFDFHRGVSIIAVGQAYFSTRVPLAEKKGKKRKIKREKKKKKNRRTPGRKTIPLYFYFKSIKFLFFFGREWSIPRRRGFRTQCGGKIKPRLRSSAVQIHTSYQIVKCTFEI